jgi:hypothetical protein
MLLGWRGFYQQKYALGTKTNYYLRTRIGESNPGSKLLLPINSVSDILAHRRQQNTVPPGFLHY